MQFVSGDFLFSYSSLCSNLQFSIASASQLMQWLAVRVEPYLIPGSFLKLKYLKTELNVDYGTYAIV